MALSLASRNSDEFGPDDPGYHTRDKLEQSKGAGSAVGAKGSDNLPSVLVSVSFSALGKARALQEKHPVYFLCGALGWILLAVLLFDLALLAPPRSSASLVDPSLGLATPLQVTPADAAPASPTDELADEFPSAKLEASHAAAETSTAAAGEQVGAPAWARIVRGVAGPEQRLVALTVTASFVDLAENSFLSLARLGLGSRVLFVAQEEEAFAMLQDKWPDQVVRCEDLISPPPLQGAKEEPHYGSPYFSSLTARKPLIVRALLELGITVAYADSDIVWLQNPFPHVPETYDLVFQWDTADMTDVLQLFPEDRAVPWKPTVKNLCACFFVAQPTATSKGFMESWDAGIRSRSAAAGRPVIDQSALTGTLLDSPDQALSVAVLPSTLFASGCFFFDTPHLHCNSQSSQFWRTAKERNSTLVSVHGNWAQGHDARVERFRAADLWLLPSGVSQAGLLRWQQTVRRVAGQARTVIVVAVTSNYMDLADNFFMSLARLGRSEQVLLVAEDQESFELFHARWPRQVVAVQDLIKPTELVGQKEDDDFRSLFFSSVTSRKPYIMIALLSMGVTVIYADSDVVWLEDPLKHIPEAFDMTFQLDTKWFIESRVVFKDDKALPFEDVPDSVRAGSVCSCLLIARPTDSSRRFLQLWADAMERDSAEQGRPVPDQTVLNNVMWNVSAVGLQAGILAPTLFPSGCVFFGGTEKCNRQRDHFWGSAEAHQTPVVFAHNNFIKGRKNKVQRFKNMGIWFLPSLRHNFSAAGNKTKTVQS